MQTGTSYETGNKKNLKRAIVASVRKDVVMDAVNVVSERIQGPVLLFGVEIEAEATSDSAVFAEEEEDDLDRATTGDDDGEEEEEEEVDEDGETGK